MFIGFIISQLILNGNWPDSLIRLDKEVEEEEEEEGELQLLHTY
jgi:hypothetical protein